MMRFIRCLTCALVVCTIAGSEGRALGIDVVGWFDGCAGLSENTSSELRMDQNCFVPAKNCRDVGRPCEDRRMRRDALVGHLIDRAAHLRDTLPPGDGLTGFAARRFPETRDRLLTQGGERDCEPLWHLPSRYSREEHCLVFGAMSDRIEWRRLHRSVARVAQEVVE